MISHTSFLEVSGTIIESFFHKTPEMLKSELSLPCRREGEMLVKYLESALKLVLMVSCLTGLLYANSRSERMFSMVAPPPPAQERDAVEETLADLKAPTERVPFLNRWIRSASDVTRLDPILLCCLLHTESRFRKDAVSTKGYKGEAQTLRFSQYSSVNILEGAETLREKLSLSKGDMFEALARYKGGKDNKEAREGAKEVLRLYRRQLEKRTGKPLLLTAAAQPTGWTSPESSEHFIR